MGVGFPSWITRLRITVLLFIQAELILLSAFKLPDVKTYDESFLDDMDTFPDALDVTVTHNDKQTLLRLQKTEYLDVNIPSIALHDDGVVQHLDTVGPKKLQTYQDDDNGAAITISCEKMEKPCRPILLGSYFHNGDFYHLETLRDPSRLKRDSRNTVPLHRVYRRENPNSDIKDSIPEPASVRIRPGKAQRRKRRQTGQEYVVEVLLILDYVIYKRFSDSVPDQLRTRDEVNSRIKQYFFQVANGMDARYKSIPANDYTIRIRLSDLIIAEKRQFATWTELFVKNGTVDAAAAIKPFAETKEIIQKQYKLSPFDHAMAITGYDLVYKNKKSTLGYAYLNTTCQYWSVSLVEDRNDFMKTVWTATHELGHSLCAMHDGPPNNCRSHRMYIMTSRIDRPTPLSARNPWLFSSCSVQYFREMVDKLNRQPANCLLQTSTPRIFGTAAWKNYTKHYFGVLYNPDTQCQRIYGPSSHLCRYRVPDPDHICTNLWCQNKESTRTESECLAHLAADGTTCGNKKWCQKGQCVFNQAASTMGICPFGDQPGHVSMGLTCSQAVSQNSAMCHDKEFRTLCCQSCEDGKPGLRIHRGTVSSPSVGALSPDGPEVAIPAGRVAQVPPPELRSNFPLPSRSSLGITFSTASPTGVVVQPLAIVTPKPNLENPPIASPTETSDKVRRVNPQTGACVDTRYPLGQYVIGCRGFLTFCYLRRVMHDCCFTCRHSRFNPALTGFPVAAKRRRRAVQIHKSRVNRKKQRASKKKLQETKPVLYGDPLQEPPAMVKRETQWLPELPLQSTVGPPDVPASINAGLYTDPSQEPPAAV